MSGEENAAAHVRERSDVENPIADAELVVYKATEEFAEEEPTHDNLRELGLVSWSLWARWPEDGVEIPLVGEASWHIWYSLFAESFHPDPAEPVSDEFVAAIQQMVDEEIGEAWGDVEQEVWEDLEKFDRYLLHLVRDGFLKQRAAEPGMVVDWCVNRGGGQ